MDKITKQYNILIDYCHFLEDIIISNTNYSNHNQLYIQFLESKILEGS